MKALITGASSGIGKDIARYMSELGYDLIVVARRKETLENLAKNIASKVKKTRRALSLEPMNPYERRIIHSALQGDRFVTTHSEGEEPFRRVVVTLKNK